MKKGTKGDFDIDYVAKLANLDLTNKEKTTFEKQLKEILSYFSTLSEIDTSNIDPIDHITNLTNVVRKDEPAPSLSRDEALKNAPKTHNSFFQVDAIFEER